MNKIITIAVFICILMPINVMAFENNQSDITTFFEYIKEDALEGVPVPVITSPENGRIYTNEENITIEFDYKGSDDCYVQVSGIGSISILQPKNNRVTIAKGKLVDGKSYCVSVSNGNVYSEAVEFTIDNQGKTRRYNDIMNIVNNIDNPDISMDKMFPEGICTDEAKASSYMESILVNVWRIDEVTDKAEEKADKEDTSVEEEEESENVTEYKKYSTTMYVTVNAALRDKVKAIFDELYKMEFPVKYAGGYCWRDTHGNRLSEHAIGTAIDINYEENYCLYSDGSVTGKLYKPGENPYSVTDEVVAVFKKYGFYWGGEWDSPKDYMHFSYYDT